MCPTVLPIIEKKCDAHMLYIFNYVCHCRLVKCSYYISVSAGQNAIKDHLKDKVKHLSLQIFL